jgi:hypothetical protein
MNLWLQEAANGYLVHEIDEDGDPEGTYVFTSFADVLQFVADKKHPPADGMISTVNVTTRPTGTPVEDAFSAE